MVYYSNALRESSMGQAFQPASLSLYSHTLSKAVPGYTNPPNFITSQEM